MSDLGTIYSHPGKLLKEHLQGVIEGTQVRSENNLAILAAFFHDIGKINPNFQKKLLPNTKVKGYSEHAFLSAYIFHVFYCLNPDSIDKLIEKRLERITTLKALIAKHHGDLPNLNSNFVNNDKEEKYNPFKKLEKFILESQELQVFEFIDEIKDLIGFSNIERTSIKDTGFLESLVFDYSYFPPSRKDIGDSDNVSLEQIPNKLDFFLETQFAFGLLLDADKRDASGNNLDSIQRKKDREEFCTHYLNNIETHLNKLHPDNELNILRTNIRHQVVQELKQQLSQNREKRIFTLTAPTGAGKTYMLLALAAEILKTNPDLSIIYSLPFLSITEQVEEICKKVFNTDKENWITRIDSKSNNERISQIQKELDSEQSQEKLDELIKEKYSEETFEKPFIITTFVQFFETLLSNRNSQCMRLPNFANRIFLIDEIQALPPNLYTFFVAYLDAFCKKFNSYAIVSTATMPDFRIVDKDLEGKELFTTFNNNEIQKSELLGQNCFQDPLFNRYSVHSIESHQLDSLAEHILENNSSCLVILNTIGDSEKLWDILRERNIKCILLNTRFTPEDRKNKIKSCKELLQNNEHFILISTQLIEAGVDISFPIVYRDLCPLPSLIQSAGRCNRNNDYREGKVYFFTLIDENGKRRADLIYRDSFESYLQWTEELIPAQSSLSESELFEQQKTYFESIAENKRTGEYKDVNLIKSINELAFEDVGKFRLIDKEMGEEYKYYIPDNQENGQEKYKEIKELLFKLSKEKEFQARKYIKIKLDKLKSEIENRTISLRLNPKQHPFESSLEPLLGIHWLQDLSKYKAALKGLQLTDSSVDSRII
jgi:CRISPR-associated endonuclease/helicase Cas3